MRQVVEGIVGISAGTRFELSNPMVQDVRASCQADVEVGGVQAQHLLTSHCKDCRALALV